ncbi:hypothetical protein RCL1_009147 [Eukaryota sp. TZLM3-RCL]
MSRKRSSTILPHPEDQAGESLGEPERFLDAPPEVVSKRKMFVPKSGGSSKPAPPPKPSPTPSTKAPMTLESNGQTFVPPLGQATKMFDVNVTMFSEFVLLSEKQQQEEEEKSKKDQQKPVKQQEPTPLPTLKPSSQPPLSEQETHSEAEKSLDEDGESEEEDASSQNKEPNPFTTNPFGFASKSPSSSQTAPAFGFSSSSTNPFSFPSLPSEGSNPFLMATTTSNPFTSSSTFPPTPAASSPFASNPFAASQQSTQESSQRDSDEDTEEEEDVKPDIHLMQTGEEDEVVKIEVAAVLMAFKKTKGEDGKETPGFVSRGSGTLKVLLDENAKASRIVMRNPSLKLLLNDAIHSNFKLMDKSPQVVQFLLPPGVHENETGVFALKFKTADDCSRFKKAVEECKVLM